MRTVLPTAMPPLHLLVSTQPNPPFHSSQYSSILVFGLVSSASITQLSSAETYGIASLIDFFKGIVSFHLLAMLQPKEEIRLCSSMSHLWTGALT